MLIDFSNPDRRIVGGWNLIMAHYRKLCSRSSLREESKYNSYNYAPYITDLMGFSFCIQRNGDILKSKECP